MPILEEYFYLDSNNNFQPTPLGAVVVKLMKQRKNAWLDNRDYVLRWFRGMNVQPSSDTVLEFSDELQEYVKFGQKQTIWDERIATGDLIKWDYYARTPRPENTQALAIGISGVSNIVDDPMIEDRKLKLDAGVDGFQEYEDRVINFTYLDVFTQSQCATLFNGFDPISQLAREHVLAWFKGMNLQPTFQVLNAYKRFIQAYLLDPRKEVDSNIDIGIFLVK